MRQNLLLYLMFLLSIVLIACKAQNIEKTDELIISCENTKSKLEFPLESAELKWLQTNSEKCSRINEFLGTFEYSDDSIEYMQTFVKMKLKNENYKLERFIELYCLLQKNPAALIDGTLDKKKE
ncbi:hypothetical protein ML462_15705 [Gramella lutea]|uniref:Uncharacterized protein n=1 Tax=Christiangramia lutea TaxID=1607951 RepID=A0A9X2AAD1_9FLAO|nr:hypothetical protein [Christiangramia lutea]MCH4824619.1 hypothetical protein [Christiangramia lutea]